MFISQEPLSTSRYAPVPHSCDVELVCSTTGGVEDCLIPEYFRVLPLRACPIDVTVSRLATLVGLSSSCSGCFLFTWRSRRSRRENVVRHRRHANEESPLGRVWRSECRLRFSWRVKRLWQTSHSKGCSLPTAVMVVILASQRMFAGRQINHHGQAPAMQRPRGHRELKATIAAIRGQKGRNEPYAAC